ncbi:hypothetical protein [Ponticaulis sp.]|uniref:hypothetical protein n=1 Tax=Ponticaulis sp. TaxID=2020902 RepID=UPI00260BA32E|nr:hypothetical protein [Ponticaulis sp.]MDF1679732.1 hypothetical protein [Ponticaulis sp.]
MRITWILLVVSLACTSPAARAQEDHKSDRSFNEAVDVVIGISCLVHAYDGTPYSALSTEAGLEPFSQDETQYWLGAFNGGAITLHSIPSDLPNCTAAIFGIESDLALETIDQMIAGPDQPDFITFERQADFEASRIYHQRGEPFLDAIISTQPGSFGPEQPSVLVTFHWGERSIAAMNDRNNNGD